MDAKDMQADPLATQVALKVIEVVKELRGAKGLRGLIRTIPHVVKEVESLGNLNGISGEGKKSIAINAILMLVPLPVWIPKPLVGLLISWLIERAVAKINEVLDAEKNK